jgi:hypothetical protein
MGQVAPLANRVSKMFVGKKQTVGTDEFFNGLDFSI